MRSVEKSQQRVVEREVRALNALDHENVLRFDSWYETKNHFWLVMEYCAGGNLKQLLAQDKRLPESTVVSFGLDVLAGLQHAHAHSVLAVDLRPTGLLIDECGTDECGRRTCRASSELMDEC